ncbi:formyltetrahydrofolate deformylase [Paenarthrobacter aurescens]|uniref:Formyltetrahydrofolate deformylase n=1 Tax=Paenarthrobacter aurescens TaxID=43663 RepID=A0A4Y3NGF9_PAEAU|nr:formyltetrahydrofolate deformylase [Paenarthrobacter aurescens]UKA50419.1 formyltetrahydrofolate deformylase [Arthrobacter sp. FW305-123]MDO6145264.1 formyltetrahydrofolate deformylase [Paenarthrobacter aurescens]MDO6145967.1 formyltetrahydrofolate deformylase [Paenarthrobacter aurescens]MDO6157211.1 formyltetrahydrofolate deformylase [Paenarthrobacter aurescens]MDO6161196.1 formyltetrahydrofolate deformylase [Paenarthrobacter aurescens]
MTLVATDSPVSTLPKPELLKEEQAQKFVLTLSCVERAGIVQAVTTFLYERGFNIEEHQQFDDGLRQTLHLRTAFSGPLSYSPERLEEEFSAIADRFEMKFSFHDQTKKRVLVMVSKFGHCLNDLIFRWRGGSLGGDLVVVASNHETHRAMAEAAGLPFVYIPVTPDTKAEAEQRLLDLVEEYNVDLVVLARYMQVLSDDLCRALEGRAINIHHSFLPGFKGARPYHQAYDRGVKLVGATAHYVTADLDEGPIIEQEVIRVDHSYGPTTLSTVGQDAEALALSRAVRWHCEHRVLLDQTSTVVFR